MSNNINSKPPRGPFAWISLIDPFLLGFIIIFTIGLINEQGFWPVYLLVDTFLILGLSISLAVWSYNLYTFYFVTRFDKSKIYIKIGKFLSWIIGISLFFGFADLSNFLIERYSGQPEYVISPCSFSHEDLTFEQEKEIDDFWIVPPNCDD